MAKELDCVNPKCREDLLNRMVTKNTAKWIIGLLIPIAVSSLAISLRVWGVTEFYSVNQIKVNTFKLDTIDAKVTKMETQLFFLNDRIDKQLDRIKSIEASETATEADRKIMLDFLRRLEPKLK